MIGDLAAGRVSGAASDEMVGCQSPQAVTQNVGAGTREMPLELGVPLGSAHQGEDDVQRPPFTNLVQGE